MYSVIVSGYIRQDAQDINLQLPPTWKRSVDVDVDGGGDGISFSGARETGARWMRKRTRGEEKMYKIEREE